MRTKAHSPLLRNRSFRQLFLAYALASFGDWFDILAIEVLVAYRWGVDPFMLALIPVVMALPGVLLGSFAGTIADRVRKARLMMVCDVLTAALTLGVLTAPNMIWLLPLLAFRAVTSVFHVPAQQALTKQVVPSDMLLQATSLNGLVNQISKVAGPLLGALTLAVLTPQACIILNAVARLASAGLLWPLRSMNEKRGTDGQEQAEGRSVFWKDWREGWVFLLREKRVLHTMVFGFFGMLALMMIDYQFPVVMREINPENESLLGWLISAIGAGAVGIIIILNRLNRVGIGFGLGGGYVLIGAGIALLGNSQPGTETGILLVFGVLIGIGNGLYMVTQNYTLQSETPSDLTGRIFGIQNTIISCILLTAPFIGGLLIHAMGAGRAFVFIGLITALIGLTGLLLRSLIWPSAHEQHVPDNINQNG